MSLKRDKTICTIKGYLVIYNHNKYEIISIDDVNITKGRLHLTDYLIFRAGVDYSDKYLS